MQEFATEGVQALLCAGNLNQVSLSAQLHRKTFTFQWGGISAVTLTSSARFILTPAHGIISSNAESERCFKLRRTLRYLCVLQWHIQPNASSRAQGKTRYTWYIKWIYRGKWAQNYCVHYDLLTLHCQLPNQLQCDELLCSHASRTLSWILQVNKTVTNVDSRKLPWIKFW